MSRKPDITIFAGNNQRVNFILERGEEITCFIASNDRYALRVSVTDTLLIEPRTTNSIRIREDK